MFGGDRKLSLKTVSGWSVKVKVKAISTSTVDCREGTDIVGWGGKGDIAG